MKYGLRRLLTRTVPGAIGALLLLHAAAQPARPAADEIQYLLAAMEHSGCEFYRNCSWYSATEAHEHLRRKLAEVEKKQPLRSAAEFIDVVATRSSISGEPYRVRCPDAEPVASAAWFRQVLDRYRRSAPPSR